MNNNKYAIELQNKADKLVESYKNVEKIKQNYLESNPIDYINNDDPTNDENDF